MRSPAKRVVLVGLLALAMLTSAAITVRTRRQLARLEFAASRLQVDTSVFKPYPVLLLAKHFYYGEGRTYHCSLVISPDELAYHFNTASHWATMDCSPTPIGREAAERIAAAALVRYLVGRPTDVQVTAASHDARAERWRIRAKLLSRPVPWMGSEAEVRLGLHGEIDSVVAY